MKKRFSFLDLPWRRKRRPSSSARRRRTDRTVEVARAWWLRFSPARVGLALGTTLLLSLLLCIPLWPNRISLEMGDTAPETILAQRTVTFEDAAETRRLREEAAERIGPRYNPHPQAAADAQDAVQAVFRRLDTAAQSKTAEPDDAVLAADIRARTEIVLSPPSLSALLRLRPEERARAARVTRALVDRAMAERLTDSPDTLEAARAGLAEDRSLRGLPEPVAKAVTRVASGALRHNLLYDAPQTQRERERARSEAMARPQTIHAREPVVRAGDQVTALHLAKLEALGLRNPRLDAVRVALISVMVLLLVALVSVYLSLFHADLYRDTPRLLLLAILTLFSVAGLKVGSALLGLPSPGVHLSYLGMMCVASAGMAVALLLSPQVATLVVALLSVASGLILNNELRFTGITLGSSLVGIVSVATLRNRGDLVRAMFLLCGANVLLIGLVGQIEGDTLRELGVGALWGVVSGLFALVLFWLGVAVFEKPFGITTHLRLLELSDPATPILQEFRMRVPGTYAHSLMVGNLAHAAAETIGADALLTRVAAYYHDLGKMNRPEFFIENQCNAENVHDRLNPSLSALILTSHVKDGLEMAEEVGLPPKVREVIRQHHGTSLMKYFYYRATGGAQDPTLEAQFRYPGPKPQSKEAAILMLADSVEAASRCLDKPTPARITDFVRGMVEEKRADGQLDDCDLTLRDLKKIQQVFVRTLSGTLHARIDYPAGAAGKVPPPPTPVVIATHPEEALDGALTRVPGSDNDDRHGNGAGAGHGDSGANGAGAAAAGVGADANGRREAAHRRR